MLPRRFHRERRKRKRCTKKITGMKQLGKHIRLPEFSVARWGFVTGVLVYTIFLYVSYVYFISPHFDYLGFVYRPESVFVLVVAEVLSLIPSFWTPIRLKRPSQIVYLLLYLWAIVPSFMGWAFMGVLSLGKIVIFGSIICVCLYLIRCIYFFRTLKARKLVSNESSFWFLFFGIATILYSIITYRQGINVEIPSIREVYLQREEFRRALGGIGAYFFNWLAKALNPFLIAWGYINKNILLVALGTLGQVFLFSMSGLKSVLFSFLLLAAIAFALRNKGKNFSNYIVWSLVALIAITSTLDYSIGVNIFSSLFVRRLLFVPGQNMSYYFDFFSNKPNTFFSHSFFGIVSDNPYGSNPSNLIGDIYGPPSPDIDVSANANLWADGYASFGIFGIFLFSAVLSAIMWISDSFSSKKYRSISVLILAYPAYMLTNTKLQTTFLTHGLGVVLLLLYLLPPGRTPKDES